MTKYRIGDFANYLGVTPDLIKHYEKYRIIEGVKNEQTNYRYYSFWQSSSIFYSKMYQNMGFTLKEISYLLKEADSEQLLNDLKKKSISLQQTINKESYILNSLNNIVKYEEEIINNTFDGTWEIKNIDSFFFLPHSENCRYLQSLTKESLIQQWINLLPITSLSMKIEIYDCEENGVQFGLSVDSNCVKSFDIDTSSPVVEIKGQKVLVYKSKLTAINKDPIEISKRVLREPMRLIKKHNFTICGDVYVKTLFQTRCNDDSVIYRLIYIPIM